MTNVSTHVSVWLEQSATMNGDSLHIELSGSRMQVDTNGHVLANESHWHPLTSADSTDVTALAVLGADVRRAESLAVVKPQDTADVLHSAALGFAPRGHLTLVPRSLGGGRAAVCRYSPEQPETALVLDLIEMTDWCEPRVDAPRLKYNTFVIEDPTSYPVDQPLETCAAYTTNIPGNWGREEWHRDPTRCPADGLTVGPDEPNVLVVKRRY